MSVKMHVTGGGIIEDDGSLTPINIDNPPPAEPLAEEEEKE